MTYQSLSINPSFSSIQMHSPTIFIDENIPFLAESLSLCGRIIRFSGRNITNSDLKMRTAKHSFVRSITKVHSELLTGTNVRFVGTATAGTEHIDIEFLQRSGIQFASATGSNANSVAEYVLFAMLECFGSIREKTVGVIGYGNIGRRVAEYCRRYGARILLHDPPLKARGYLFPDWAEYVSIMQLCGEADCITNHVPLNDVGPYPTRGLLGYNELNAMKHDAVLIHTSRGGVVDETELVRILGTTDCRAAIDVWCGEPLIYKQLAKSAVLATPHIAGYSLNAKINGARMMAEAYSAFSHCTPVYSVFDIPMVNYESDCKESEIYTLLQKNRKLLTDSSLLQSSLLLSDTERAREFDNQRKNYPERLESLKYND
ncbi:MAG: 4-phosphoerythronate dehydrogenase [Ignavibacteria bacterium]|nr:4-phosphoerythronate dehydrogenase [Ignavibacteria bacterium]